LQKFNICPSSEDFCGNKEIQMNGKKEFELSGLPENHICKYTVQVPNENFDTIFKLVMETKQNLDVGMYYRSRWLENKGHTEVGMIGEDKCLIANNCTLDANNQYTYYLSNTQEVSLVVLSDDDIPKEVPSFLLMQLSKVELSNKIIKEFFYYMFLVLAACIIGFVFIMKLFISKE